MSPPRFTKSTTWLNRFAWLTATATLVLICSGGMVTSKGVGLAVPDWPTTFGYNMFLFPVSKWVGGIFFEHTHRLIASTVGFLTIILAVWIWVGQDRQRSWRELSDVDEQAREGSRAERRVNRSTRSLALIAVAGVVLQGILGGLRVTMLKDEIGIFHACLAQAFLGLIVVIALMTTNFWRSLSNVTIDLKTFAPLKTLALATTIAIYVQLALGATMRHEHRDLAILDFPTANGMWIPDTSPNTLAQVNSWRAARGYSDVTGFQIWLQMTHRFLALVIAIAVFVFCLRVWRDARGIAALRRLSICWVALLFLQLTLGAWTIWSDKAADIATAHVAVGATMLSFGVSSWAICWRILHGGTMERSTTSFEARGAEVT